MKDIKEMKEMKKEMKKEITEQRQGQGARGEGEKPPFRSQMAPVIQDYSEITTRNFLREEEENYKRAKNKHRA